MGVGGQWRAQDGPVGGGVVLGDTVGPAAAQWDERPREAAG